MNRLYIALVHYPIVNKCGERIMTSITNLDIHDIARAAKCYGVIRYYIIHPDGAQKELLASISRFWLENTALPYNPDRSEALSILRQADTIDETIELITTQEKMRPIIVTTTARNLPDQISFGSLKTKLEKSKPVLLLFGTGFGLCDEVHDQADYTLQPIKGFGDFNHLSVRSAVAVVLDRLCSDIIYGRNHGYSAPSWQRPNQNRLSRLSRRRYGQSPL